MDKLSLHNGYLDGNGVSAYAAHADHNHDAEYLAKDDPTLAAAIKAAQDAAEAAATAAEGASEYAEQYYSMAAALDIFISAAQAEILSLKEQVATLNAQVAALQG